MSDWIFHGINAFGDLGNGRSTSLVHSLRDELLDVVTRIHMIAEGCLRLCRAYLSRWLQQEVSSSFLPIQLMSGNE